MLTAVLIILASSVSLSVLTVLAVFRLGKRPGSEERQEDGNARYYDRDGNHLYYDRKLIARLEKERAVGKDK